MAKKGKRKQSAISGTANQQSIESLCNLTGLGNNYQVSELEGCLAEFDAIQSPTAVEGAVSTPHQPTSVTVTAALLQDNGTVTTGASLPCMDPISKNIKHSTVLQQRVDLWHDALRSSTDSSSTTSIFLPNIRVEMARHLKMSSLSEELIKSCPGLRMPVFERWIMDSKLLERNERRTNNNTHRHHLRYDPVIPSAAHIHDEPTQRLMSELMELSSISQDKAESLCVELCMNAASSAQDVQQLAHRLGWNQNLGCAAVPGTSNKQKKKRKTSGAGKIVLERDSKVYTLVYKRGKEMKPFVVKINASHYEKLRHMFNAVHTHASLNNTTVSPPESRTTTVITHAFHVLVFVMLLRYSSLSGGQQLNDLRGGGMQGAIHGSVFSVLQSTLGCTMECFASPLNAHFPQFCSAFYDDLEWHFGSVGDFFDVSHTLLLQGCYEVNPPFAPGVMNQMSESLESCLDAANIHERKLTFVVIVPTAKPNEAKTAMQVSANSSFRRMTTSAHCSQHVVLQAREHGYVEGSQHLRPTRFKESQYDTSVIILQSVKSKETIGSNFETLLRAAFESLHEKEIEERKGNDDTDHTHAGLSKENSTESVTASRNEITPVQNAIDEPLSPQGLNDVQKSDRRTRKSQKKKKKARHKETN